MNDGRKAGNPATQVAATAIRLPPIGFWSYSRQDDDLSKGKLSNLRGLLMAEIQQQYGRDRVQLFQDVSAIPHGAAWEREITNSLNKSTFFIPIITPNFIQSEWCCAEVRIFLEREIQLFSEYPDLPHRSRIFPLHLIDITGIDPHDQEVLNALQRLQWFDFRRMRHRNLDEESVQHALSEFAASIRELLHTKVRPPPTKEDREREAAEAAAALKRKGEAAIAQRERLEEERRQRDAAKAEAERARVETERQALATAIEAERRATESAEAKRLASAERAQQRGLARKAAAARWARHAPFARRIAIWTIAVSILVMSGVLLLSLRERDKATVETDRAQPGPVASVTSVPKRAPAPAMISAPDRSWLYGRWCVNGNRDNVQTISGDGNRIVTVFSGRERQVETIRGSGEGSISTEVATYARNGDSVIVSEPSYSFRLEICR